ncbi:MAG: glutamate 5-kinase [Oligoflexia bacterium]|nr:glutamate 5-kinase [Oligoflexia bacterium]
MKKQRWVVKVGSQMVCAGGAVQIRSWMTQVRKLSAQHNIEVIWVTSGAIATALERTRFRKNRNSWKISESQALSAIGQPLLMDLYLLAINALGMSGAQVLLTYDDIRNSIRKQNLKNTLSQLLKWKTLPLINENDAVSSEEIRFGDNDSLSAKVAILLGADQLVILTDVDGLYDKDPRAHDKARLIHRLDRISEKLLKQVKGAKSSKTGTGGIYSKLKAAREAGMAGIKTVLVRGDIPHVLEKLAQGEAVGTLINPRSS